jgi:ATP-dependent RNA helicase HrpB
MNERLPIDGVLGDVVSGLDRAGAVIVDASPGAGKTTRVPRALLERDRRGEIVVLEPRRLAARLGAARVAAELGEEVGATVGYQVRFDKRASSRTRIRFVTEGVLTRWLTRDPELGGVATVVLDELHERHLHADLALALCERLRRERRGDLEIVAMSATLEAAPVAELLAAEVVRCDVRRFDVAVEHLERASKEPLELLVAAAVRRAVREGPRGHVLVFLPGAQEIRRAAEACSALASAEGLRIVPLHGSLPAAEQDAAVRPSPEPKLVLATNVAETSITIDGVVAVVDSGLARIASSAPWSALPSLRVEPISRASATQRAGRAGRTAPGRCLRLYTAADFARRPAYDTPEIARLDLGETVLAARIAGVDPATLRWLTPPPPEALAAAERLLADLGALAGGAVTAVGHELARLPLAPRLARALVEARRLGVEPAAATALALLSEGGSVRSPSPRRGEGRGGGESSSLWHELALLEEARDAGFSTQALGALGLDRRRVEALRRARRQLCDDVASDEARTDERALALALLAGFPDRVARRIGRPTQSGAAVLALAGGGNVELADAAALGPDGFTLLLEARAGDPAKPARAQLAVPIAADWLLEAFPAAIDTESTLAFHEDRARVEAVDRLRYRGLVLTESRAVATPGPEAAALLFEAARRRLDARGDDALARLLARARSAPELAAPDDAAVLELLCAACAPVVALADLPPLADLVRAAIDMRRLEKLAPDAIRLRGGRELPIQYPLDGAPPFVASYLQDFFGQSETPRLGSRPLVVHLWAPSGRPLQVTSDLASFWRTTYPELRRQLSRRYPKHFWPDDPATAPAKRFARDRG